MRPSTLAFVSVALLLGAPAGVCHAQSTCERYGAGVSVGTLDALAESSGLAASYIGDRVYWTHNDSGDSPRLFAIREDGTLAATLNIAGASAIDWEDMAVGPCGWGNCACLFAGDVGDNEELRGGGTIFRVISPYVVSTATGATGQEVLDRALTFVYPDGPHNAETILVDPVTGVPYIVTKDKEGRSAVYRFPSADPTSLPATLVKVADLDFLRNGPRGRLTTGGSVSGDGARIVIRTYKGAFEWEAEPGDMDNAFSGRPLAITLPMSKQGEAISYTADGRALLTTTEGAGGAIHRMDCLDGDPVVLPSPGLAAMCSDAIRIQ